MLQVETEAPVGPEAMDSTAQEQPTVAQLVQAVLVVQAVQQEAS
jgi:hypothetical protein